MVIRINVYVENDTLRETEDRAAAFQFLNFGHEDVVLEVDGVQPLFEPELRPPNRFQLLLLPRIATQSH